ncbi:MAG: D-ribose pyranase [Melioribacteraceae bacterium]|nr:D-ribose pyranase [Melioribacteraceae bacterium]MCF8353170.1 D-ribose pyranase [Melioribacteraceae bacterium]MCF8418033.1 D-ribose pyranase [Melioribacteraceae bacterium]
MKKNGIINSQLSRIIAQLGHSDKLVICDCGLPIPRNSEIVDLALIKGIPEFIPTLKAILDEVKIDGATIAEEIKEISKPLYQELALNLDGIKLRTVPHEEFKKMTNGNGNIIFIRTGEATSYANIILECGVTF